MPHGTTLSRADRAQIGLPFDRHARRVVEVRRRLFGKSGNRSPRALPLVGERVLIEMFPGEPIIAVGVALRENAIGVSTWSGEIDDGTGGSVSLSVNAKGRLYGYIEHLPSHYLLAEGPDGRLYAADIDQSSLPGDEEQEQLIEVSKAYPSIAVAAEGKPSAQKNLSSRVIDVLVVYTPQMASRYVPELLAESGIASMNTANQFAGIDVTVRLVGLASVSYIELSNMDTMLNNLVGGVGELATAHQLREELGADIVVMLTDGSRSPNACGRAGYPDGDLLPMQRVATAFAVVADSCVTTSYTFAHEVGHVLGLRHERGNPSSQPDQDAPYAYSRGYVNNPPGTPSLFFRTLMAADVGCTLYCPRILRWSDSNPAHTYGGYPLGIAPEQDTPQLKVSADNAKALFEFAPVVAGYKDAAPPLPLVPPYPVQVDHICGNTNRITWGFTPGADFYEVFRKTQAATTWTLVYAGPGLSMDLNVTVSNSIKVRACNGWECSLSVAGNGPAISSSISCP